MFFMFDEEGVKLERKFSDGKFSSILHLLNPSYCWILWWNPHVDSSEVLLWILRKITLARTLAKLENWIDFWSTEIGVNLESGRIILSMFLSWIYWRAHRLKFICLGFGDLLTSEIFLTSHGAIINSAWTSGGFITLVYIRIFLDILWTVFNFNQIGDGWNSIIGLSRDDYNQIRYRCKLC